MRPVLPITRTINNRTMVLVADDAGGIVRRAPAELFLNDPEPPDPGPGPGPGPGLPLLPAPPTCAKTQDCKVLDFVPLAEGPIKIPLSMGAYALTITGDCQLVAQDAEASATRSAMGANLSGWTKWVGAVLGVNGKIYGIPYDAEDILVIDPVSGTATRSDMGASLSGSRKWRGGVAGLDGKIYGIPYDSSTILVIDPESGTATRSAMGAAISGSRLWSGGALAQDGKIYGIPYDSSDILIIDPASGTAILSSMGADMHYPLQWSAGVLGHDKKIYGIPRDYHEILIIDPSAGTATLSTMGADLSGSRKWTDGVLGADGKIYGIPSDSNDILIIDPASGTAVRTAMGLSLSDDYKWFGGAATPDGKIYGFPHDAEDILIIDTTEGTATRSPKGADLAGWEKWWGGALGPDCRIYGIPDSAEDILIIDPAPPPCGFSVVFIEIDTATPPVIQCDPDWWWVDFEYADFPTHNGAKCEFVLSSTPQNWLVARVAELGKRVTPCLPYCNAAIWPCCQVIREPWYADIADYVAEQTAKMGWDAQTVSVLLEVGESTDTQNAHYISVEANDLDHALHTNQTGNDTAIIGGQTVSFTTTLAAFNQKIDDLADSLETYGSGPAEPEQENQNTLVDEIFELDAILMHFSGIRMCIEMAVEIHYPSDTVAQPAYVVSGGYLAPPWSDGKWRSRYDRPLHSEPDITAPSGLITFRMPPVVSFWLYMDVLGGPEPLRVRIKSGIGPNPHFNCASQSGTPVAIPPL